MNKSIIAAAVGTVMMISGQAAMADGKGTYDAACFACHGFGAAGAPKFGDKAAWAPRIAKGMDLLKKHAMEGFKGEAGFMPAKGGRTDLADADVQAAVEYMVSNAQ
ncbi:MAG: c-type cytochrome [Gammaproteobacteria bacterium]|nr:c-type cytochrome [Gammaproteobacteria bacterium]